MYIMNPISDTESEPDQNAPIVESLEKTKPKRKGVAPTTLKAEEPKQVPPPKPKRQLTERQLEALAKAREKRALARKAEIWKRSKDWNTWAWTSTFRKGRTKRSRGGT